MRRLRIGIAAVLLGMGFTGCDTDLRDGEAIVRVIHSSFDEPEFKYKYYVADKHTSSYIVIRSNKEYMIGDTIHLMK